MNGMKLHPLVTGVVINVSDYRSGILDYVKIDSKLFKTIRDDSRISKLKSIGQVHFVNDRAILFNRD